MSSLLDLAPCVMKDTELEKKPVPNSSRTMFVVRQEALMSSLRDLAPCVMKDTELEKKPVPNSSRTMFVVRQEALMSSLWDLASLLAILSVTGSFVALRLKAGPVHPPTHPPTHLQDTICTYIRLLRRPPAQGAPSLAPSSFPLLSRSSIRPSPLPSALPPAQGAPHLAPASAPPAPPPFASPFASPRPPACAGPPRHGSPLIILTIALRIATALAVNRRNERRPALARPAPDQCRDHAPYPRRQSSQRAPGARPDTRPARRRPAHGGRARPQAKTRERRPASSNVNDGQCAGAYYGM